MAVIAALHDPLAIFLADNSSDVMAPDHDGADARAAGVGAVMGPGSREIVGRTGVAADLAAHVPAAPGTRPPARDMPARRVSDMTIGVLTVLVASLPIGIARVPRGVMRVPRGVMMMPTVMRVPAEVSMMIVVMIGAGFGTR